MASKEVITAIDSEEEEEKLEVGVENINERIHEMEKNAYFLAVLEELSTRTKQAIEQVRFALLK